MILTIPDVHRRERERENGDRRSNCVTIENRVKCDRDQTMMKSVAQMWPIASQSSMSDDAIWLDDSKDGVM